jgi:hypothetical protein
MSTSGLSPDFHPTLMDALTKLVCLFLSIHATVVMHRLLHYPLTHVFTVESIKTSCIITVNVAGADRVRDRLGMKLLLVLLLAPALCCCAGIMVLVFIHEEVMPWVRLDAAHARFRAGQRLVRRRMTRDELVADAEKRERNGEVEWVVLEGSGEVVLEKLVLKKRVG